MTPYVPLVNIDADVLDEKHWQRLPVNTLIRAYDQAYILALPITGWKLSCFVKADNQRVTGRTTYRRPASVRAWVRVAIPAARKVLHHWFSKTP